MEENPEDENSPTECEEPFDMDQFIQTMKEQGILTLKEKELNRSYGKKEKRIKCETGDKMVEKEKDLKIHKKSILKVFKSDKCPFSS